jgi:flagellar biosynthesis repressor protein FlbT
VKSALQIGLRAREKIYVNGAVISVDRKVRLSLLNDAVFLLGSQVMQLEDARTPLQQLYFLIQGMLIDPKASQSLRPAVDEVVNAISASGKCGSLSDELMRASRLMDAGRLFESLKLVRGLAAMERGTTPSHVPLTFRKEVA